MKKKDKKEVVIEKLEIRRKLKTMEIPKHNQEAKGQIAQSGMLVARDMVVGGFVGGMGGSGLGRWSLATGVLASGLSYYFGIPGLAGFGIGMAAAGWNQKEDKSTPPPVNGTDMKAKFSEAQERMKSFAEGFKRKLWLDKIPTKEGGEKKSKEQVAEDTTTQNVGALGEGNDPLAEIEQQLVAEAINFQRENGVSTASDFAGTGSLLDDEDFENEPGEAFRPDPPRTSEGYKTMEFSPESDEQTIFQTEKEEFEIDFDTI